MPARGSLASRDVRTLVCGPTPAPPCADSATSARPTRLACRAHGARTPNYGTETVEPAGRRHAPVSLHNESQGAARHRAPGASPPFTPACALHQLVITTASMPVPAIGPVSPQLGRGSAARTTAVLLRGARCRPYTMCCAAHCRTRCLSHRHRTAPPVWGQQPGASDQRHALAPASKSKPPLACRPFDWSTSLHTSSVSANTRTCVRTTKVIKLARLPLAHR